MFGHLPELAIVLVIALIVFGPEKLPEVAANAGKMVREVRQAMDQVMNPEDHPVPDDFSAYYYESLERTGEVPAAEAGAEPFAGWPGVAGPEAMDAEGSEEANWVNAHPYVPEGSEFPPIGEPGSPDSAAPGTGSVEARGADA